MTRARLVLLASLAVTAFGVAAYAIWPSEPTTIGLAWMDSMVQRTDEDVTRSMAPATVKVYRALRVNGGMETTFENLEFRVPQAYTLTRGIPQLPLDTNQGWGDLIMHVQRPSGRPSIFFEDFINERLRWFRPGADHVGPPSYPLNHYFLIVEGRRGYTGAFDRSDMQRRRGIRFHTNSNEWPHARSRGEVCGWQAFDKVDVRHAAPRPPGVFDIYFDSIDPAQWRRTIECGPNSFSYCRLSTQYRQFGLTIGFSPANICNARAIEDHATELLDRHLVAHHPPTRQWSNPERRGGREVEWTNRNLNNPNIMRDARND